MGGSGSGNRTPPIRPNRKRFKWQEADGPSPQAAERKHAAAIEELEEEQDLLRLARKDFKKYGAVTREDRIALASRFVRNSDPMIALQYSKLLEQMERGADSAETGLPAPTVEGDGTANEQAQDYRLSRMMSMTGKVTTDRAYEMFLSEWREHEGQRERRFRSQLPGEPADAVGRDDGEAVAEYEPESGGAGGDGPVAARGAADSDERIATDDNFVVLPELHGATQDHSPAAGAQPQVAAGDRGAAPENRAADPEPPQPIVDPVRPKWHPNYGGVPAYVEEEDGDPE